jgi:hypothetical protein
MPQGLLFRTTRRLLSGRLRRRDERLNRSSRRHLKEHAEKERRAKVKIGIDEQTSRPHFGAGFVIEPYHFCVRI